MVTTRKQSELKKQIEYYLSDKNLVTDAFFHGKITAGKDGWVDISDFQNCNKVKVMKVTDTEIAEAIVGSEEVELSKDKKQVRRVGNKAAPALEAKGAGTQKKREAKAQTKEETKQEDDVVQLDSKGNAIFANADFENPAIIHFKTEGKEGEKINWKEVETEVKAKFPNLKVVYSRADPLEGDLAISQNKTKPGAVEKLTQTTLKIGGKDFTFTQLTGEDLKQFWQKQGGHYQFCIQPKLRNIKKQQKQAKIDKATTGGEVHKRSKLSYEIAGAYYSDINKVKSKARAILNLKKDGEKLSGNDEEFMKELLKFHDKGEAKSKDFVNFEVGEHPDFAKTRCFFVVRKDGTREDFSISKCIINLEKQS